MDFKDLKQHIKELMTAMGRSGIKRLVIKNKELEIELERAEPQSTTAISMQPAPFPTYPVALPTAVQPVVEAVHDKSHLISSPMVGTFYAASSPEAPPFVKVNDAVVKGEVVCIIEAMKVMNEIKSDVTGTIVEVLVASGDPVEFGTKLFRVR